MSHDPRPLTVIGHSLLLILAGTAIILASAVAVTEAVAYGMEVYAWLRAETF